MKKIKKQISTLKLILVVFISLGFSNTILAQINCTENSGKFYGIGNYSGASSSQAIYEYTLSGSSLTLGSISSPVALCPPYSSSGGVAIADFGGGEKFYMPIWYNNRINIVEYNGISWDTIFSDTSVYPMNNPGGHGSYLYFETQRVTSIGWPNRIMKFDGTQLTTLWYDTTTYMGCADFAVDNSGNVYFFTGSNVTYKTDYLHVMSPAGNFIANIPVSFDFLGLFGCFFYNNQLYMGFRGNTVYGDSLVEVNINGNAITFGQTFNIPSPVIGTSSSNAIHLLVHDLASCYGASISLPSGVADVENQNELQIFPNPANDYLKIKFAKNEIVDTKIYNQLGVLIAAKKINTALSSLDISYLPKGIYFLAIESHGEIWHKNFVKN